jgi:hypothetical protein
LLSHYRVESDCQLVVTGVDVDQPIENYWRNPRRDEFLAWLTSIKPALVTAPNFSLFNDVPREENLHAMKRIAICWQEMVSHGVPTALHLNARTDRDWDRWLEFLALYPEVTAVAFEFKTGAATRKRGRYHSEQLIRIAKRLGRPLTLVVRGGFLHLPELARAYQRVVFLSSTPFVKVKGYPGRRWVKNPTPRGAPIDGLLVANLREYTAAVETRLQYSN